MIEGTVEQIVKVTAPKISIFYRIILVIACLLAATTIEQTGWLGVIVLVIFIFFTVFVFEYYNAEYEYSYVNGSLTIDKIMAKSVRKNVGSFDLTRATLVAKVNSQEALGKARQQLRTYNCSSGVDDPGDIVIYTYDNDSNEMIRLFMLPDDSMKEAIVSAVGNGVAHL